MPLLMCPNCNASMQTINRANVEFDMCPTCRGVWLDRGELEKLMEISRAEASAPQAYAPRNEPPPAERSFDERARRDYDEDDDDRRYGKHGRRKRGFDLFDIFD